MLRLQTRQQRADVIARECIRRAQDAAFSQYYVGDSAECARAIVLAVTEHLMHYRSDPRSTTMATNTSTTSGMPASICNSSTVGGAPTSGSKPAGGSVKTIDPKPGGTKITKVGGGGPSKNYSY